MSQKFGRIWRTCLKIHFSDNSGYSKIRFQAILNFLNLVFKLQKKSVKLISIIGFSQKKIPKISLIIFCRENFETCADIVLTSVYSFRDPLIAVCKSWRTKDSCPWWRELVPMSSVVLLVLVSWPVSTNSKRSTSPGDWPTHKFVLIWNYIQYNVCLITIFAFPHKLSMI